MLIYTTAISVSAMASLIPGAIVLGKIEQLVNNPALRSSLIAKAYERVGLYDWLRCARDTKEIYERVLK
jgi:hypothetical protein